MAKLTTLHLKVVSESSKRQLRLTDDSCGVVKFTRHIKRFNLLLTGITGPHLLCGDCFPGT